MSIVASQITGNPIIYFAVYSNAHQRLHQSNASLAFVMWPVDSPHTGPVTRKHFHLMTSPCFVTGYFAVFGAADWPYVSPLFGKSVLHGCICKFIVEMCIFFIYIISMGKCKRDVTSVHYHYVFLALIHRYTDSMYLYMYHYLSI